MRMVTPTDGWGKTIDKKTGQLVTVYPRAWQSAALPTLLQAYVVPTTDSGVVSAIMGSGKSTLIAQMLSYCQLDPGECIIVSAPTILLVRQLAATLRQRLDGDAFMSNTRVGCYYTDEKDINSDVIVACTDSLPVLGEILKLNGRKCAFWIVDEGHLTENETTRKANEGLAPERLLGFTATPFLADEDRTLSLFKRLVYKYRADEAMRDGVVVNFKIINYEAPSDEQNENGKGPTLNEACIQMANKHVADLGPGLFNAFSIADAEKFADELRRSGKSVSTVHSKLSDGEVQKRLADLEAGRLWAVVYVHMLSAGFDMPSLRFLCLRRPIASRVAFAQTVGRIMRASEGKKEAIILDPHDLFPVFSITPEEALGGAPSIDESSDSLLGESERQEQQMSLFADEVMKMGAKVRAGKIPLDIKPMQTYLTTLVSAFDICGLTDRKVLGHSWRSKAASRKQQQAINNMNWVTTARKCIPRVHQRALGLITGKYEKPEDAGRYAIAMNRGTASDLVDILKSLADVKKWPDVKNLDAAASDSMNKAETASNKPKLPTNNPLLQPKPAPPKLEQGALFDNAKPRPMQ